MSKKTNEQNQFLLKSLSMKIFSRTTLLLKFENQNKNHEKNKLRIFGIFSEH